MKVTPHPDYKSILAAVRAVAPSPFDGTVFRYAKLRYARTRDITSGVGAALNGGRWNAPGTFKTVYGALDSATAHAEHKGYASYAKTPEASLLPLLLVAIDAKGLTRVLDLTDAAVRRTLKVALKDLVNTDWRAANLRGEEALTQAIGRAARKAGFEALLVPSAQAAKGPNLVFFPRRGGPKLVVQKGPDIDKALAKPK